MTTIERVTTIFFIAAFIFAVSSQEIKPQQQQQSVADTPPTVQNPPLIVQQNETIIKPTGNETSHESGEDTITESGSGERPTELQTFNETAEVEITTKKFYRIFPIDPVVNTSNETYEESEHHYESNTTITPNTTGKPSSSASITSANYQNIIGVIVTILLFKF